MSKKRRNTPEKNYNRQRSNMLNTILKAAGRSLDQALKDTFFRERLFLDKHYNYLCAINNDPIADFMITQIDNKRALIDMAEYQGFINATNETVKAEATKAVKQAIDEITKEYK